MNVPQMVKLLKQSLSSNSRRKHKSPLGLLGKYIQCKHCQVKLVELPAVVTACDEDAAKSVFR